MSEKTALEADLSETIALLRAKLGVRGKTLDRAVRKARHRLPRRVYRQAQLLAGVESMAHHPKLRLTLDTPALKRATQVVRDHLEAIDLADRRKGWWLGMAGGLAVNLLLAALLLLAFLRWRGLI